MRFGIEVSTWASWRIPGRWFVSPWPPKRRAGRRSSSDVVARIRRYAQEDAARARSFDVALTGYSTRADRSLVAYAEAGVTWWFESLHSSRGSERELLNRIEQGPPG